VPPEVRPTELLLGINSSAAVDLRYPLARRKSDFSGPGPLAVAF
jgi:hypothetical protein